MGLQALKKTLDVLKQNKINYWICHGTLLGIIREKRILPWDDDIDFAVWKDEYSRAEIEQIFDEHIEYTKIIISEEIDSLHYLIGKSRVDINFYTRNKDIAYIRWFDPKNLKNSILSGLLKALDKKKKISFLIRSRRKSLMIIKFVFFCITKCVFSILGGNNRSYLKTKISKHITYLGYCYPLELMRFKKFTFENETIVIPVETEKYLATTYGEDWQIPNKNFVWNEEAKNLFLSENDN